MSQTLSEITGWGPRVGLFSEVFAKYSYFVGVLLILKWVFPEKNCTTPSFFNIQFCSWWWKEFQIIKYENNFFFQETSILSYPANNTRSAPFQQHIIREWSQPNHSWQKLDLKLFYVKALTYEKTKRLPEGKSISFPDTMILHTVESSFNIFPEGK